MNMNFELCTPTPDDYIELASWIEDAEACELWAGPEVQFPFSAENLPFLLSLNLKGSISFSLRKEESLLVGFGQMWPRRGSTAHLGRIIISPNLRGKGFGRVLVSKLLVESVKRLGYGTVSLKVRRSNERALRLYENMGFRENPSESDEARLYMEKTVSRGRLRVLRQYLWWLLQPLRWLRRCYRKFRPELWVGELQDAECEEATRVLCVARTKQKNYLFGQVLGPGYRERCIGRAWLWNIERVARRKGCCAIFLQVRASFHRLLGRRRWLCIPKWVGGVVDIPLSPCVLNATSVKKDLRRIRKHALCFDVTQSIKDLEDFYYNMYVPYIRQRHGDHAFIMSFDTMREEFKSGELLRVTKDGMPIAGEFIRYGDGGATFWVMGIRDGNREFVRQGAIGATKHLSFQYLRDRGFTEVGLGNSAPFFNDGAFQYKKRLGMRLIGAFDVRFFLGVPDNSKAAEAFLQANPFIFESDGTLCGAVFVDARDPSFDEERLKQICRDFYIEGMSRLLVVTLGSPAQAVRVPPELADKMSVCAAAELFGWGPQA